jgi:regulator of protease activity HflC (stomatin/prohibitin superfamily)
MSLLAKLGLAGVVSVVLVMYSISFGIHVIDEGYVGVYYRGGKLLNAMTGPGYNVRNPFFTTYE